MNSKSHEKKKLEDRIVDVMVRENLIDSSISSWSLADLLWDNCMQKSQKGNGIKIANIKRVVTNSNKLDYFIHGDSELRVVLSSDYKANIKK